MQTRNENKTPVGVDTTKTSTTVTSIDNWSFFDTKMETTEKNTATNGNGMGSVDLLGLSNSFSGFNQTPSNADPPSSFSLFDFSPSSSWSQSF